MFTDKEKSNGISEHLEDFLTAFRLIIINPAQNEQILKRTGDVLSQVVVAIVRYIEKNNEKEVGIFGIQF